MVRLKMMVHIFGVSKHQTDGIFFVNTLQKEKHCDSSAFLFGNEAHLRCMKNEAGLRPMKRAFGSRSSNVVLRFTARARRFIEAVRLLLPVRGANASFSLALRACHGAGARRGLFRGPSRDQISGISVMRSLAQP